MTELELFTFPGTWRLRLHHIDQVENSGGRIRPAPDACRQGRTGVRKWEHGRVACWRPDGGSQAVLHWIDERSNLYGIIRAEAGANRRLDDAWRTLRVELAPHAAETADDQAPSSSTTDE